MWLNIGLTQSVLRIFALTLCKHFLEHLETVNALLLLTSLKASDWSGHVFSASASPRSWTKNIGKHNASRSLQSGGSTVQPGEPTADICEISLLEKHVLYHPPHPVLLLLLRIYNPHVIRHNTSSPWSACSSVLQYIYQHTRPGYRSYLKKTCEVCSVQCVVCSVFHVPH